MRRFEYPDLPTLEACISSVLADVPPESDRPTVLQRQPNPYQSSLPSEIVTCGMGNGRTLQLFVKYDLPEKKAEHGHWYTVAHEAEVYRDVLQFLPISVPKYYGTCVNEATGQTCLVVQWIDGLRADKASWRGMLAASRWLGRFHAIVQPEDPRLSLSSLHVYDTAYYTRWAQETLRNASGLPQQFGWLSTLCERFVEAVSIMVKGPAVLVHGEFYPHNILVRDSTVYPVDWQSAAIARGELDLASLTEGWRDETLVRQCESEYEESRWPGGTPPEFHTVLALARVYWPLRWLGADPASALSPGRRWYFDQVRLQGHRAGLL